jgi:hypothetical protein
MKSWCCSCYFEHCTAILIKWTMLSFDHFLNTLNDEIALIRRLRRLFEKSFYSRWRLEFVAQNRQNMNVVLRIVHLHNVEWSSRNHWWDLYWILKMITLVDDNRQSRKSIDDFVEIQTHENELILCVLLRSIICLWMKHDEWNHRLFFVDDAQIIRRLWIDFSSCFRVHDQFVVSNDI